MKITLRIVVRDDARTAIARDPELVRSLNLATPVFELNADDPRFARVLDVTKATSGCWLNPIMQFSAAELAQARLFQLECRGKVILETEQDGELNRARLDARAFHRVGKGALRIKLIDRIALSRIAIAANAVGCASDWMAEFIVSSGVAQAFEQQKLTGYTLKPVLNAKIGKDHPDYFQLYSESIMPAAELDATTLSLEGQTEEGGWRELGCLTYALPTDTAISDFNRTAENWSNHFIPLWVVSARVRECFQRHKFKGWAFRPVLEKGTPLQRAYAEAWSSLLAKVAANPRNRW